VEEYRPATFEVKLGAKKPSLLLGDKARVDVTASYLYGAPLAGGRVAFHVRRRDHIATFDAFPSFTFSDLNALDDMGYRWARWEQRSYSYDVTDEEAELDEKGRAVLRFDTRDPANEIKTAQDFLVEATVSDAANQAVSKST